MAEQLVQQAGLARVRPADDGSTDAASQNPAFVRRAQQFVHEDDALVETGQEFVLGFLLEAFLGKIDVGLDVRERVHQVVTQQIDALRKLAGKLLVGGAQREFGTGVDEIGDGLGLREVDAAVEKGALGKFARFGQSRAGGERGVEHQFGG